MHAVQNRQSIALIVVMFFAALASFAADVPPANSSGEELQRLRARAVAQAATSAEASEWLALEYAFRDLVRRYPENASARDGFAEFLWDRGEQERAISEWEAAAAIDPQNGDVWYRLGDAHLAKGCGKSATRYFQKACDAAPTIARFHYVAGTVTFLFRHELVNVVQSEAKILAKALAHFAEAVRLAPLDIEYARAYAETFYGIPKPDWSKAISAWEHFMELTPNKDFAYANLARVTLKMGQYDTSRKWLGEIQSSEYERLKKNIREQIDRAGEPK